uniref:Uncharacterized protein n=1 Tax=Glossina austeni TaxID=7395 RepID=A0A1A9V815_GLOAU
MDWDRGCGPTPTILLLLLLSALLLHTAALALTDNCRRVDGLRSTERNDPALLTNLDAATSGVSSSISRTQDTESVFSITALTTGDEGEISFCLSSRTQRKLSASLCKREISIFAIELLFLGELLTALSFKLRREVRSTANSSCDKFSLSFNSRSLFSLIARSWSSSLEKKLFTAPMKTWICMEETVDAITLSLLAVNLLLFGKGDDVLERTRLFSSDLSGRKLLTRAEVLLISFISDVVGSILLAFFIVVDITDVVEFVGCAIV